MPNTIFVAVTGGSGSGKTLVADNIVHVFKQNKKASVISLDRFYKHCPDIPLESRAKFNFDIPESIDWELFDSILRDLRAGKKVELPVYDFTTHLRLPQTDELDPSQFDILIFESILVYSLPRLRHFFDLAAYVDTEEVRCFIRRQNRDVEERGRKWDDVCHQYLETVHDAFKQHTMPVKDLPGMIVIDNNKQINVKVNNAIDPKALLPLYQAIRDKLDLQASSLQRFANDSNHLLRLSITQSFNPQPQAQALGIDEQNLDAVNEATSPKTLGSKR